MPATIWAALCKVVSVTFASAGSSKRPTRLRLARIRAQGAGAKGSAPSSPRRSAKLALDDFRSRQHTPIVITASLDFIVLGLKRHRSIMDAASHLIAYISLPDCPPDCPPDCLPDLAKLPPM